MKKGSSVTIPLAVPVRYGPRRAGDPPRLMADASKIRNELGWSPRFGTLETIIEHAWQWELSSSTVEKSG